MARIHRRGLVEPVSVYDLKTSVAPHVYDKDRRYALLIVDMLNDFVYGKIKYDRAVPISQSADILPTRKIVRLF